MSLIMPIHRIILGSQIFCFIFLRAFFTCVSLGKKVDMWIYMGCKKNGTLSSVHTGRRSGAGKDRGASSQAAATAAATAATVAHNKNLSVELCACIGGIDVYSTWCGFHVSLVEAMCYRGAHSRVGSQEP